MVDREREIMGNVAIKRAVDMVDKERLLDEVVRVEAEAWPEEIRAQRESFVHRLSVFPEGFFLAYVDGRLAGVSTSEKINLDVSNPPISWEHITDNGSIVVTHTPSGNAIYVVSVGVSDWAQGRGIGTKLIEAQKELTEKEGLEYLVLGARLSGFSEFHRVHREATALEYANSLNESGEPQDREIRFYTRAGLRILKVIQNYMEDDPESENWGVAMIWKNGA